MQAETVFAHRIQRVGRHKFRYAGGVFEAFGARPRQPFFLRLPLPAALGQIQSHCQSRHHIQRVLRCQLIRRAADQQYQFGFVMDIVRIRRQHQLGRPLQQAAVGLEKHQRRGGLFIAQLADVGGVIAADAENIVGADAASAKRYGSHNIRRNQRNRMFRRQCGVILTSIRKSRGL